MISIKGTERFEYTETITNGATSELIYAHRDQSNSGNITCTLIAGANTGKFQVSTSSKASIIAGSAIWTDWAEGDSTGTVSDVLLGSVTGIRGVSVSGEVTIEVVV